MSRIYHYTDGNQICLWFEKPEQPFLPFHIHSEAMPLCSGRGGTYLIQPNWVLRHYYRGGFMQKLYDRYLFLGLEKTRAWQEIFLLNRLYTLDLPVPKPIACRVIRHGLFYTADLITQYIPETKPLSDQLSQEGLSLKDWYRLGQMIALFHKNQVYHTDLNANNILCDQKGQFWLIDFDKCYYRPITQKHRESNAQRLHRSLNKWALFNPQGWNALLEGMDHG